MFSTSPFVCVRAHVRVGVEEFSDRLAVDLLVVNLLLL